MTSQRQHRFGRWLVGVVLTCGVAAGSAWAGTYKVVYTFTGGADGGQPLGAVVQDPNGNLYGETLAGADNCASEGCGTVYKVDPAGHLTTHVAFTGVNGANGSNPLVLIGQTLFGSTGSGGKKNDGVLFSVGTDGTNFTILHSFKGTDGLRPIGALRPGPQGAGYGVTNGGGAAQNGVLYELKASGSYTALHSFTGGADGGGPNNILVAASGTIFGSAQYGGPACSSGGILNCGLIFEYVPSTGLFTVIHNFAGGVDGSAPILGSIGADGTLYGATPTGGMQNTGTLFSLQTSGSNPSFVTLATFDPKRDGSDLTSAPTLDPQGGLTGTLGVGPRGNGISSGALYRYSNGRLATVAPFGLPISNGFAPHSQPILTQPGGVIGTAQLGGLEPCDLDGTTNPSGCGTIYSYTP